MPLMPRVADPANAWTDEFIGALPTEARVYELADPGTPGLRLRVTTTGRKVFRWAVTSLDRVFTIGRWSSPDLMGLLPVDGGMSLEMARDRLRTLKAQRRGLWLAASGKRPARARQEIYETKCDPPPPQGEVVYFVYAHRTGRLKIGTSDCARERVQDLAHANASPLQLLWWVSGGKSLEGDLHRRFSDLRLHGEWFRFIGPLRMYVRRMIRAGRAVDERQLRLVA